MLIAAFGLITKTMRGWSSFFCLFLISPQFLSFFRNFVHLAFASQGKCEAGRHCSDTLSFRSLHHSNTTTFPNQLKQSRIFQNHFFDLIWFNGAKWFTRVFDICQIWYKIHLVSTPCNPFCACYSPSRSPSPFPSFSPPFLSLLL